MRGKTVTDAIRTAYVLFRRDTGLEITNVRNLRITPDTVDSDGLTVLWEVDVDAYKAIEI